MNKKVAGLLGWIVGVGGGIAVSRKLFKGDSAGLEKKVDKFKMYYELLNTWLKIKQNGKSLETFFEDNHYKKIGIYGMGELGNRLCEELSNSNIEIVYTADKAPMTTFSEMDVIEINEMTDNVDVVVVTPIFDFDNIKHKIEEYINVPVISLEDIIFGLDI